MTAGEIQDPMDFSFSTGPENYRHIKLEIKDGVAHITLSISQEFGLRKDTPLKLNSYDLGVDIELADAINRIRFEYPEVSVVLITSALAQVFSSGANIYMLKKSSHAFKVNFCKYTNETRLYIEESSRHSGLKFLAALNGTAAGGGYELALACDRILLVDDKFASVSLPEVPLLGVLPGTGGLTRLVDKRKVRRDLADIFCTTAEGIKGEKAKLWGLVDEIFSKSSWQSAILDQANSLKSPNKSSQRGIRLDQIAPKIASEGFSYEYVSVSLRDKIATIFITGPKSEEPTNVEAMMERGSELWLLKAFRELDDAVLRLRFFYREHGLWLIETKGNKTLIQNAEEALYNAQSPEAHWFLRELLLHTSRVLRRLDTSSRSMVALIEENSAYVGILAELLFIADRSYARAQNPEAIRLTALNHDQLKCWSEQSRLALRFLGNDEHLAQVYKYCDQRPLDAEQAYKLGLITAVLDEIDFDDELRLFLEERTSLSPDALSAMEANLRFNGPETLATKIFGRLSAWQNWVFTRDNSTGKSGALSCYGEGTRPQFDFERC